jgi:hypothetical protein
MNKEHIPFVTVREDFCEYRVDNGQILKMKVILTDIAVETTEDDKKSSLLGIKDFSALITENEIDTSKMEYSTPEQITDKDVVSELSYKTVREVVNIYDTQKVLILVAPRVLKIFSTNKKDRSNAPLIRYTYKTGLHTVEKEVLYIQKDTTSQQDS